MPFIFIAVAPPRNIPEETGFDTFNALMSRSEFLVRFDDGMLLDGRNTPSVSGFHVLQEPQALVEAWCRAANTAGLNKPVRHEKMCYGF